MGKWPDVYGYSSFSLDITHLIRIGNNVLTVYAEDDNRSGLQPRGKQSATYHSRGCDYTRTTGIWQTVWLELVPETHISSIKLVPDPHNGRLHLEVKLYGDLKGCVLEASTFYNGAFTGMNQAKPASSGIVHLSVSLSEVILWEPGHGRLYDLKLKLVGSAVVLDEVDSYFGLRSISLDGMAFQINGKSVFQRLVLDQGFYPEGIYTAPTDADLRNDIEIALGLGFNGARLHEKIFEPRFLYWADRLGYIVWAEHANWGLDISDSTGLERFLPEWTEMVERDRNHPSIIGWCPFNETVEPQDDDVLRIVYEVTKILDPSRPVIDTSGYIHVKTDIFDVHDYDQNPETFKARYEPFKTCEAVNMEYPGRERYNGQPYFVSEYGGIWWNPGQSGEESWGYGDRPTNEQEFLVRYAGLTNVLLDHPRMFGFCYTQLYDVEQEVNGLYTYDRKPKFDPKLIYAINIRKAAIEVI